ncbi:MAG: hypothetical protein J6K20_00890, partial [Thermoguttaceae bacterium]|nr:hypothetical protein [Thermoguttaceae bacterium]
TGETENEAAPNRADVAATLRSKREKRIGALSKVKGRSGERGAAFSGGKISKTTPKNATEAAVRVDVVV